MDAGTSSASLTALDLRQLQYDGRHGFYGALGPTSRPLAKGRVFAVQTNHGAFSKVEGWRTTRTTSKIGATAARFVPSWR